MKKLFLIVVCLFTVSMVAKADNDKPINVTELPATAQTFINTYFKGQKVAMAKQETEFLDKTFDVMFTNGEKIEFNKKGEWTEVQCRHSAVPEAIIPEAIKNYVKTNYPEAQVLQIERDNRGYEIRLSNRWEISFDKQMRVVDIDD